MGATPMEPHSPVKDSVGLTTVDMRIPWTMGWPRLSGYPLYKPSIFQIFVWGTEGAFVSKQPRSSGFSRGNMKEQGICKIEGCENKARNKGHDYRGIKSYGSTCQRHHKTPLDIYRKFHMTNEKCEKCGWDEAPCDRHRINRDLGYVPGNVIVLCPNCHRIEDFEKMKAGCSEREP